MIKKVMYEQLVDEIKRIDRMIKDEKSPTYGGYTSAWDWIISQVEVLEKSDKPIR